MSENPNDQPIFLGADGVNANPAPAPTLDTGAGLGAGGGDNLISTSDTEGFMRDVIEASSQVPVIVDFWAPWCEPCKTLGPTLEKLVRRAGGLVRMVKINVDENQPLAQQLQIKSIPTVYAFKDGRPVDAFQGALPESQLQAFIDKLLGDAKPPVEEAMEQAHELLSAGKATEAEDIYTQILANDPTFIPALAGMVRASALGGDVDRARDMVDALDEKTKQLPEIVAAISALELAEQGGESNADTVALEARVSKNEKDHAARFELAQALYTGGNAEGAIEHLLKIVSAKPGWNDDAARQQLVRIFDALGTDDPRTVEGRRQLSILLFS